MERGRRDGAGTQVFSNWRNRVTVAIWLAVVGGAGTFISRTGATWTAAGRGIIAVFLAGFAWLIVRTWRVAICASPEGLVVRNIVSTTRLSWSEIASFTPPQFWTHAGDRRAICITLVDGRRVWSQVCQSWFWEGDLADRIVASLRALHEQYAPAADGRSD